jgi:hypothetical protein
MIGINSRQVAPVDRLTSGVWALPAGLNVLRLLPPLNIPRAIWFALDAATDVLRGGGAPLQALVATPSPSSGRNAVELLVGWMRGMDSAHIDGAGNPSDRESWHSEILLLALDTFPGVPFWSRTASSMDGDSAEGPLGVRPRERAPGSPGGG